MLVGACRVFFFLFFLDLLKRQHVLPDSHGSPQSVCVVIESHSLKMGLVHSKSELNNECTGVTGPVFVAIF